MMSLESDSDPDVLPKPSEEADDGRHDPTSAKTHAEAFPKGQSSEEEWILVADERFGVECPLFDVEPPSQERLAAHLDRDTMAEVAKKLWAEEVGVGVKGVEPLPPLLDGMNVRKVLAVAQEQCPTLGRVVAQKRDELDPSAATKRRTGVPKAKQLLQASEAANYRLAPDGVLERTVVYQGEVLEVPCMPDTQVPGEPQPMTWRVWLFLHCHETFMQPHRKAGATFQLLRRAGWWPTLSADFNAWFNACEDCHRHRTRPLAPPLRSMQADDARAELLPWQDVVIDVQGPFTKAEGGEQYLLSYHCTSLKVPKLCAFPTLQAGHFSRALVTCIMKARIIPNVVRSDRGPEMASMINREFLALCRAKQVFGAALTPRHQGMVERGHQELLTDHLLLIHAVCKAYPQEWASLVEPLEYLCDTEPQGELG